MSAYCLGLIDFNLTMTELQFLQECHLHLPLWKCLEIGCKAQYEALQRHIREQALSAEGQETQAVLEALYLLSVYFPESPVFDCTDRVPAAHASSADFQHP